MLVSMDMNTGHLELYMTGQTPFTGLSRSMEEARYVVVGVPYDRTSTYRAGSRFAPSRLREASANVETYSLRSEVDIEDVPIFDAGDLNVADDIFETLRRLQLIVREIHTKSKVPIIIGGEHTITYGSVQAFDGDVAIVDFDAHLDLRDEYMGCRMSHTTCIRRLIERIGSDRIIQVGTRAVSKGELEYARNSGLKFYSAYDVREQGPERISEIVNSRLKRFRSRYITIDMDVLDPAYAPGVGNPEGEGLDPHTVIDMLRMIVSPDLVGMDLVEVCPDYDNGATAAQAVKILFETIAAIEQSRSRF
ncbi:MAG: agmatinase [Candidatus Bathyarchaeia archaeon]